MTMTTGKESTASPLPITRSELSPHLWSTKIVFRHGQCDPAGIVYTPEFFDVFNQVIEKWFCEKLGVNYYEVLGSRKTGLGYAMAAATFFTPCAMGDEIEVFVDVARIGSKSYNLILHALKGDDEALRGQFVTVTTSLQAHQSTPIPEDIRQALIVYSETARR